MARLGLKTALAWRKVAFRTAKVALLSRSERRQWSFQAEPGGWSKTGRIVGRLPALLILLLYPASAHAHKLYVYPESIEGATIHGRAYFPGDVPAQHSDVIVRDASGRELGRTMTDDKGKFTFTAHERTDLYLSAETPDGHVGAYTIQASELPGILPAGNPPAESGAPVVSQASEHAGAPAAVPGEKNEPASVSDRLTELNTQVQLLRRQVSESDERLRFRDILGGIGFILGLAGVAFYMKARRGRTGRT